MMFKKTSLLLAVLVATGGALGAVTPKKLSKKGGQVTHFVAFGDSYTDNCNTWRNVNASDEEKQQYPFPFCPPAPEGRASGGQSWPELIRIEQGQTIETDASKGLNPLQKGQWNVTNLAQSAGTCDNTYFPRTPVWDVGQSIHYFKSLVGASSIQTDPATSVAAIFIGTNDISFYTTPDTKGDIIVELDCIKKRLRQLHDFGFRRMLLLENINLEYVPLYSENGVVNGTIKQFTLGNNKLQSYAVQNLNAQFGDGTQIEIFPTHDLFQRMYDNPSEYGFTTVTSPCDEGNGACPDKDNYLWYNDLHPGEAAERILARKVIRFLEQGARGDDLLAGPN